MCSCSIWDAAEAVWLSLLDLNMLYTVDADVELINTPINGSVFNASGHLALTIH